MRSTGARRTGIRMNGSGADHSKWYNRTQGRQGHDGKLDAYLRLSYRSPVGVAGCRAKILAFRRERPARAHGSARGALRRIHEARGRALALSGLRVDQLAIPTDTPGPGPLKAEAARTSRHRSERVRQHPSLDTIDLWGARTERVYRGDKLRCRCREWSAQCWSDSDYASWKTGSRHGSRAQGTEASARSRWQSSAAVGPRRDDEPRYLEYSRVRQAPPHTQVLALSKLPR